MYALIFPFVAAVLLTACQGNESPAAIQCSDAWYRMVEEKVGVSDEHGHGPDIGSEEWQSAVEFKLGVRHQPDLPKRDSDAWCSHIDQILARGREPRSPD